MKKQQHFLVMSSYVGIGGALGGGLRVLCNQQNWLSTPLLTTTAVNIVGALALGFVTAYCATSRWRSETVLFLKTGLIGGFTTYGTWLVQSLNTLPGAWLVVSLCGTLIISDGAFWLGEQLVRWERRQ